MSNTNDNYDSFAPIKIPGIPTVVPYQKDSIQAVMVTTLLGVSEWLASHFSTLTKIGYKAVPIYNAKKEAITDYIQLQFEGEVPANEIEILEKDNAFYIDWFAAKESNVTVLRFKIPEDLDLDD